MIPPPPVHATAKVHAPHTTPYKLRHRGLPIDVEARLAPGATDLCIQISPDDNTWLPAEPNVPCYEFPTVASASGGWPARGPG